VLSSNIQKYQIAQTVIAKIFYIFIETLCNTVLFAQINILITEIYCNTKDIKFCNLNKTILIERNFEFNTKYIKVCFRNKNLKKKKNITNLYQYIVCAQYIVPETNNYIYFYSSAREY